MKKLALLSTFMLLAFYSSAQNFNYHNDYDRILKRSKDPQDKIFYPALLKRFSVNDTTLTDEEVLHLMVGSTGQPNFRPYSYLETERAIYKLNDENKFRSAVAMCDTFLVAHPLSQAALIEKSYAFHKMDMQDSSNFYMYKFRRIMKAMNWSGDGLTPETAIFAIGPTDGQNFIRKFRSSDIGMMGSGSDKYGNFCDILEMISRKEGGQETRVKLYFAIEHATKTMFGDTDMDQLLKELEQKKGKKDKKKNK